MRNVTPRRALVAVVLPTILVVARAAEAQIPEQLEALSRMVLEVAESQDEPESSTLVFQPHVVLEEDGRARMPFAVTFERDVIRSRRVGMFVRFSQREGGGSLPPPEGIELPSLIREVQPRYPSRAMRAGIQGLVWMEAVVLANGTVGDVRVTKSLDARYGLDDEAVRAVKQWEFTPALRFGERVSIVVTVESSFHLRDFRSGSSMDRPVSADVWGFWSTAPTVGIQSPSEENLFQIRSSLSGIPAGQYDVVVGVTELNSATPAVQLLRSEVAVPGGWANQLSLSSVILTERELLVPDSGTADPVRDDPYVFGSVFVAPVLDSTFSTSETLEVFFQIHNATQTVDTKPDLTVEYRLHRHSTEAVTPPTELAPQLYNENTLPAGFDGFATFNVGRVIPPADLEPDRYRLEIRVTDNSVEYPGLVYVMVRQTDWNGDTFRSLEPVRKRTLFKYVEFTVTDS